MADAQQFAGSIYDRSIISKLCSAIRIEKKFKKFKGIGLFLNEQIVTFEVETAASVKYNTINSKRKKHYQFIKESSENSGNKKKYLAVFLLN